MIDKNVQPVDIRGRVNRHDTAMSHPIGHQIARGREQERLGSRRAIVASAFVDTHVNVLPEIRHFAGIRPDPSQIADQHALMRKDFRGEPVIEIREHAPTILGKSAEI